MTDKIADSALPHLFGTDGYVVIMKPPGPLQQLPLPYAQMIR